MKLTSLKDVVEISYGEGLKSELRDESYPYPVYGANGVVGRYKEYIVDHESIVIGRKGSCGEIALANPNFWPIDTTFYTKIKDPSKLNNNYLYYALKAVDLKKLIITTSIPGINRDTLYKVKISLPDKPTQEKIVNIFRKAESTLEKRRQTIRLADEFLKSAFLEMFGDPVNNPKKLKLVKFELLGKIERGKSKHRPRNAPELLGGQYPLIQTGDVANSSGYIRNYTQTYSEIGLQQSRMWPKGTLCITIAANIAKTGILTFDACFPDSVVGFTPNEKTYTEYIQYWLSFLQKGLEKTAPESAQKNINLEILKRLNVPLPITSEQQKFADLVQKVEKLKEKLKASETQLQNLFNSLMQRAFRGEMFKE